MAQSTLHEQFVKAITNAERKKPWSLLTSRIARDDAKHAYPLRMNTLQPTVRIYPPLLQAAALMSATCLDTSCDTQFRMVTRKPTPVSPKETIVEASMPDGTSFLVVAKKNKVRLSVLEEDGSQSPVLPFEQMGTTALTLILLSLLPEIYAIDKLRGGEQIANAVNNIGFGMDSSSFGSDWKSKADIPSFVQDAAYFLDAVVTAIFSDHLIIDFGNDPVIPEQVSRNSFLNPDRHFAGELVKENLKGWIPKVVSVRPSSAGSPARKMTIGEAKTHYAYFSAHRKWTEEELKDIPTFPDDTPVMKEVLRMCRRITNTRNDLNPVKNVMWRAETGYGKSTGCRQLACILNMPFLTQTAFSRMESEDLKMAFVPFSEKGISNEIANLLDCIEPGPYMSYVRKAAERLIYKSVEELSEVYLNETYFLSLIQDTPKEACALLFGEDLALSLLELMLIYTKLYHFLKSIPLLKTLKNAQSNQGPTFLHVYSPFMRAMTKGYIIELQEGGRIKDPGVMVSVNEFNRPGARMQLANGKVVTRHADAICIWTDNTGYASSRPIDQAVIRRQTMIIDSTADDMPKSVVFDRLTRNTGVEDEEILEFAYTIWSHIRDYCNHNDISMGSVSLCELEAFCQAIRDEGFEWVEQVLHDCIIASATSDLEEQQSIWVSCRDLITIH